MKKQGIETEFSVLLNRKMAEHGLTGAKLARQTGLTETAVSFLCRGLRQPGIKSLRAISKTLEIDYPTMIEAVGKKTESMADTLKGLLDEYREVNQRRDALKTSIDEYVQKLCGSELEVKE